MSFFAVSSGCWLYCDMMDATRCFILKGIFTWQQHLNAAKRNCAGVRDLWLLRLWFWGFVSARSLHRVGWQLNTDAFKVRNAFIVILRRSAVTEPLSSYLEGAQCPYCHVLKERSTFVVLLRKSPLPGPISPCLEGEQCPYRRDLRERQCLYRHAWK